MLRSALSQVGRITLRNATAGPLRTNPKVASYAAVACRKYSSEVSANLTPAEIEAQEKAYDQAWVDYFDDKDLDYYKWKLGFDRVFYEDAVPEAAIIQSALYACRRIDNFALAVRTLELIRLKCIKRQDIYEYLIQELQPTLDELGLKTPEELNIAVANPDGYDMSHQRMDSSNAKIEDH